MESEGIKIKGIEATKSKLFSALIEYKNKRILFGAGTEKIITNLQNAGVDPKSIDIVFIPENACANGIVSLIPYVRHNIPIIMPAPVPKEILLFVEHHGLLVEVFKRDRFEIDDGILSTGIRENTKENKKINYQLLIIKRKSKNKEIKEEIIIGNTDMYIENEINNKTKNITGTEKNTNIISIVLGKKDTKRKWGYMNNVSMCIHIDNKEEVI